MYPVHIAIKIGYIAIKIGSELFNRGPNLSGSTDKAFQLSSRNTKEKRDSEFIERLSRSLVILSTQFFSTKRPPIIYSTTNIPQP